MSNTSGLCGTNLPPPYDEKYCGRLFAGDLFEQQAAQFTRGVIPGGIAPGIVELLEVIHVQHNDA
jgi:hypothetical protein